MSNFEDWALAELKALEAGLEGLDLEMQRAVTEDVMALVRVFSAQGHSGFSAPYVASVFKRLVDWKPLSPLTGQDSEWRQVGDGLEQNVRCSAVFRRNGDNASAYWSEGRVFSDNGGKTWYTSRESRVPVTFPFKVPDKPEYVYVEADDEQ